MQSAPGVPVIESFPIVPTITFVPAGQQVASSASTAVTDCCAEALLPSASVKVHVTIVVPMRLRPALAALGRLQITRAFA